MPRTLILILLLAAALRLYGLNSESLWLDEGATVSRIERSYRAGVTDFLWDTQTPLYFVIEKAWCDVFGTTEFSLRFLSVVFGVAAVWGLYLLARDLLGTRVALWSAFFAAINPFAINYSQDARPYTLLLASALFAWHFTLRIIRAPSRSATWGYLICTWLAMHSHPLGVLVMPVHVLAPFLFRPDGGRRPRVFGLMGLSLLLYVPQAILLIRPLLGMVHGHSPASWIPVPTLAVFSRTIHQYFMNPIPAVAVCVVVLLAVLTRRRQVRSTWPAWAFLAGIVGAFMLLPFLISRVLTPVYVERYTIPALGAVLVALGWAVAALGRVVRAAAVALLVLLSAFTLYEYYAGYDKDPFREAARYVRERARPGDTVVCYAPYIERTFSHYFRPTPVIPVLAPWSEADVPVRFNDVHAVWLVQAYKVTGRNLIGPIIREASAGRVERETVEIRGKGFQNPWAYHVARIHVTPFERTDAY